MTEAAGVRESTTLLVPCALCPVPLTLRSSLPLLLTRAPLAALDESHDAADDADQVRTRLRLRRADKTETRSDGENCGALNR